MPVFGAEAGSQSGQGCQTTIRRLHLEETGSTNDEALRRAASGEKAPFWLTADVQTEGKGRRGRTWISEAGNLFATLIYPVSSLPAQIGGLPLVSAVIVHDTLSDLVAGKVSIKIKWPNDILVDGQKLCGILIEQHQIDKQALIAIGIGINIRTRPDIANYPTACLADIDPQISIETIWPLLTSKYESWFDLWRAENGFGAIRAAWLDRAAGLGETISIAGETSSKTGVFQTLDENGYLVLRHESGELERISTGDVILKKNEN